MTSESSSMSAGLMSTILNAASLACRCHKLMCRSSAERKVSPSQLTPIELMWYEWPLPYTRFGVAVTMTSCGVMRGRRSSRAPPPAPSAMPGAPPAAAELELTVLTSLTVFS